MLAATASGCVTQDDAYLSGPIRVDVLDSRTMSPVAGAQVTVRSRGDPRVWRTAVSNARGVAELAPLRGGYTALPFANPPPVALTVRAAGYKTYRAAVPDTGKGAGTAYYYRFSDLNPPPDAVLLKRGS